MKDRDKYLIAGEDNPGALGIIPNEILGETVDLIYPIDIYQLRHTCLFFKNHILLKEIQNKKTAEILVSLLC